MASPSSPSPRGADIRVRAGAWVDLTGLNAGWTITLYSTQSDQLDGKGTVSGTVLVPWANPVAYLTPEYARVPKYGDFSARGDGYLKMEWLFTYWTFGMWRNLAGPGGLWWPGEIYSNVLSVYLPTAYNNFNIVQGGNIYQGTAYRPVLGQDMEPELGGYKNIHVKWDALSYIATI